MNFFSVYECQQVLCYTLYYNSIYCLASTGMYRDNVMPASGSKVKSLFGGLSKKADDSSSSSDDEQHHGGKLCHEIE